MTGRMSRPALSWLGLPLVVAVIVACASALPPETTPGETPAPDPVNVITSRVTPTLPEAGTAGLVVAASSGLAADGGDPGAMTSASPAGPAAPSGGIAAPSAPSAAPVP